MAPDDGEFAGLDERDHRTDHGAVVALAETERFADSVGCLLEAPPVHARRRRDGGGLDEVEDPAIQLVRHDAPSCGRYAPAPPVNGRTHGGVLGLPSVKSIIYLFTNNVNCYLVRNFVLYLWHHRYARL